MYIDSKLLEINRMRDNKLKLIKNVYKYLFIGK